MSRKRRLTASVIIIALLGFMVFTAFFTDDPSYAVREEETAEEAASGEEENKDPSIIKTAVENVAMEAKQDTKEEKDTIILWYTDESLKEYLESEALSFQAEKGIKVEPVLVSGVKLLEQINTASISEGNTETRASSSDDKNTLPPDIYITSHDNLLKAYYSGLATAVTDADKTVIPQNYPITAINAVTCSDKVVAYPFYYETNFLLYNKTYIADIAKQSIDTEEMGDTSGQEGDEEESEDENGEKEVAETIEVSDEDVEKAVEELEAESADPMGNEDRTNDPEVLEKLAKMMPSTMTDITTFANNYDAPETVEAVFKWDITDIFYNYFFVGNYMSVGGDHGDDNTIFNVYNEQAVNCLSVFQDMNQYFSIDTASVNYDTILQDFIDGKLVFTVATTDAIARIEEAKANGEFEYEYGVAVLPDVSSTLKSRGMSVTNSAVINGYSDKQDKAMAFGHYISYTKASDLYKKSGKLPCRSHVSYENEDISNITAEYEKSVPLPKMVEASDYWVQLEIAFTKVWNGADPDETLKGLADAIGSQIDEIDYHTPVQETINIGM
ncbi:MAG: sugar ABC transporter substrate-binding protein [Lachnospiraceae bacterium]|nr:sugar ABC transporter substrate-binding protein [Lachnospiraceae bacterium]